MDSKRIDYIERLIIGVREQIDKNMVEWNGEKCIPSPWMDASLLCSVIEKDVLPELKGEKS